MDKIILSSNSDLISALSGEDLTKPSWKRNLANCGIEGGHEERLGCDWFIFTDRVEIAFGRESVDIGLSLHHAHDWATSKLNFLFKGKCLFVYLGNATICCCNP